MTNRHFFSLFTGLLLSLGAVQGALADTFLDPACLTTGTYQDLLNTGAVGCTISVGGGASLTFSDFTFTRAGVGAPNASQVGFFLDHPGAGPGGTPIWGFEFNPGLATSGPNTNQDLLLTYKVVPHGTAIISDHLLENAAGTGSGVGEVTEDLMFCIAGDPNNTSGTCRNFGGNPLFVTTGPPPVLQDKATFGPWTSMTVSKDIDAFTGAAGGTAAISQVRDSVDVSVARVVPEPSCFGLLSVGILAIGYFGRHRLAR